MVTDNEWRFMIRQFPIFRDNEHNRRRILQVGMGDEHAPKISEQDSRMALRSIVRRSVRRGGRYRDPFLILNWHRLVTEFPYLDDDRKYNQHLLYTAWFDRYASTPERMSAREELNDITGGEISQSNITFSAGSDEILGEYNVE